MVEKEKRTNATNRKQAGRQISNPTISIITFNVNGLNTVKIQKLSDPIFKKAITKQIMFT